MDDHRTYGFEPFPLGNRSAPVRAAGGAEGPGARICKASEQRGCVQLLRALHVGSEGATRDLTRKGEGWRVTGGVGRGWPGLHQPSVRVEKGPGRTGGEPSCACRSCRRHLSGRFARTWARGGKTFLRQRRRHRAKVSTLTAPDKRRVWRRTSRERGRAIRPERKGKAVKKHGTRTPNQTPYLCNKGHPALLVEVRPGHFEAQPFKGTWTGCKAMKGRGGVQLRQQLAEEQTGPGGGRGPRGRQGCWAAFFTWWQEGIGS